MTCLIIRRAPVSERGVPRKCYRRPALLAIRCQHFSASFFMPFFKPTADFLETAEASQGRTTKSFRIILGDLAAPLVFLIIIGGVAAAQPRTPPATQSAPAPKYETRAECEADPDRTRSCCDFTERLRYASRRNDGKLMSELGPEMPTRLICHDPDFAR